jgi:hypothetical protein
MDFYKRKMDACAYIRARHSERINNEKIAFDVESQFGFPPKFTHGYIEKIETIIKTRPKLVKKGQNNEDFD